MEAGDSTTGNGDEHEAPDGGVGGVHIAEVCPDLGDGVGGVGEDTEDNAHCHDDQADAEQGVDLTDDGIDGDKGCDEVVGQNDDQPEQGGGEHTAHAAVLAQGHDQACGANCEHGTDHDQQHHREHTHDVLHHGAQIAAGDLSDGSAVVALAHHAGEVVMHAAGKDGAEGDPQEHHGAPQSTLQCTKDGSQTCNVQQLDEEQLPLGHHNVVNAIVNAHSRSFAVVRSERIVNDLAIDKVADDQERQTE